MISPESGGSNPASDFKSVVFPAPFPPISATISPEATLKLTPRSASILRPCSVRSSLTSSTGFPQICLDHRGILLDFFGRVIRDLFAVVENGHTVAEIHHDPHLVLDHQKGHAPLLNFPEQ